MADYYPPVAFSFSVSLGADNTGVDAAFQEVSGLSSQIAVTEDVVEGGENRFVHKLPTQARNTNLVMKRGLMLAQSKMFKWCKETFENGFAKPIEPQTISVNLLDPSQKPMMVWVLDRCWPVKWEFGPLNSKNSDVAMETLEFGYTTLTRKVTKTQKKTGLFST